MPRLNASEHEPALLRTILHEPEYVEAVSGIFSSIKQADKVLEGLEFFVSRRPELGMAFGDLPEDFGTWISKPINGLRVRVLFRYDDQVVQLLDAWTIPDTDAFGRRRSERTRRVV